MAMDPNGAAYRYVILLLNCLLTFGSYFCFDMPRSVPPDGQTKTTCYLARVLLAAASPRRETREGLGHRATRAHVCMRMSRLTSIFALAFRGCCCGYGIRIATIAKAAGRHATSVTLAFQPRLSSPEQYLTLVSHPSPFLTPATTPTTTHHPPPTHSATFKTPSRTEYWAGRTTRAFITTCSTSCTRGST